MSYLKKLGTSIIYIWTFLAAITYIPGLPPDIETESYTFKYPTTLKDQYNGRLNGAEILLKGQVKGPESFDSYDGILYTSCHGGAVAKLVNDKLVEVVKFGKKCDGLHDEESCGRPLGLRFDKHGNLFVIDTYHGIFKVNVKTGSYEKIIDITKPIEGRIPMIPNSIDIASNGDIYWTDSSSDFKLYDGVMTLLADPSGRLIRYNAATKTNQVLLDKLAFANGVALSTGESFLIVSDLGRSRVLKYHLKGASAGKSEIFLEGLPGIPDNIHTDGHGNFLISLPISADEEHPQITQTLATHPSLRKMALRFLGLLEAPFRFMEKHYPSDISKRIIHFIGHFESIGFLTKTPPIVLHVDSNGNILNVLSCNDESIGLITSAFPHGEYLYLGSYANDYLARIPLERVLPGVRKAVKKEGKVEAVEKPKVTTTTTTTTTTTPRPTTTTTPRPTTTTTPRPTTTTTTTTTTPRPTTTTTTTTTTPRPTTTTTTTPRPTTTTTTTTPRPTTTTTTTTPKPTTATKPPKKAEPQRQPPPKDDVRPVREEPERFERKPVRDEM